LRQALIAIASTTAGAAVGGTAGAATAFNEVTNNFLNHIDRARLNDLRARTKLAQEGKGKPLTKAESAELVLLNAADQLSDELLDRYRNGEKLTDIERKNLTIYLGNYAQVEGRDAARDLVKNGNSGQRDYEFPYAASSGARTSYLHQMADVNGGFPLGYLTAYLVRPISENEEIFDAARRDSGLYYYIYPNNANFLPTSLAEMGRWATIDALINSPVLATGGYLLSHWAGADQQTQDQIAIGLSILSDVGTSFVLPRTRISPVFGETTAKTGAKEIPKNTLQNLRPEDIAFSQRPVRTLLQDENGRYWLQSPSGNLITPSGVYDFVTMLDGTILVSRPNPNPEFSTHLGLSGGSDVSYAGSIRFGNNTGPNRGTIINWTNNSGHYQPPANLNNNAGLPVDLFSSH
jgi:hypothetical protein